jgi:hypothetical protein
VAGVKRLTDDTFIREQLKELMEADKKEEKKRTVTRLEKEFVRFEREKRNILNAIQKGIAAENFVPALRQLDINIAETKVNVRVARAELQASLSEANIKTAAAALKKEFERFPELPIIDQKAMLARYVQRIEVCMEDGRGWNLSGKNLSVSFQIKGWDGWLYTDTDGECLPFPFARDAGLHRSKLSSTS